MAVSHVDSHSACPTAKAIRNAQADVTAVIRGVAVVANTDTYDKANYSPTVADEIEETLTQASNLDHRTTVAALWLHKCWGHPAAKALVRVAAHYEIHLPSDMAQSVAQACDTGPSGEELLSFSS